MSDGTARSKPGHRANVYVPAELWAEVEEQLPDLNVSAMLQEALRSALRCDHDQVACTSCAAELSRADVAQAELEALYRDAMDRFEGLVRSGGTATGAAKVFRDVGRIHGVAAADAMPLPRPTRAETEAAQERRKGRTPASPPQLPETWRTRK